MSTIVANKTPIASLPDFLDSVGRFDKGDLDPDAGLDNIRLLCGSLVALSNCPSVPIQTVANSCLMAYGLDLWGAVPLSVALGVYDKVLRTNPFADLEDPRHFLGLTVVAKPEVARYTTLRVGDGLVSVLIGEDWAADFIDHPAPRLCELLFVFNGLYDILMGKASPQDAFEVTDQRSQAYVAELVLLLKQKLSYKFTMPPVLKKILVRYPLGLASLPLEFKYDPDSVIAFDPDKYRADGQGGGGAG